MEKYILDFTSLFVIIAIVGLSCEGIVNSILSCLNNIKFNISEQIEKVKNIHPLLKENIKDETIQKMFSYQNSHTFLGYSSNKFERAIKIPLILFGVFAFAFHFIDQNVNLDMPGKILILSTVYSIFATVINLPTSIFSTFKLEKSYGYSTTTVSTFISDIVKNFFVNLVVSGCVIYAVHYLLQFALSINGMIIQDHIINPIIIVGLLIAIQLFCTVYQAVWMYFIAPIFNKFSKLEDGELKTKITDIVNKSGRKLSQIYIIDESRRSNHMNAYCATIPFSKVTKIVIYDTLIKSLTTDEIVAIFAHELTHMKNHDCTKNTIYSIVPQIITALTICFFAIDPKLYQAFGLYWIDSTNVKEYILIGIGLVSFLLSSIMWILIPLETWLSRKMEYKADAGACELMGSNDAIITGLIKLHLKENSDYLVHPFMEAWYYSHPALQNRIKALQNIKLEK